MRSVQRVTTDYVPVEDRVRLRVLLESSTPEVVDLWFTRRLLNMLVNHLLRGMDAFNSSCAASLRHEFDQERAISEIEPQTPVDSNSSVGAYLISSVTITVGGGQTALTFKAGESSVRGFVFSLSDVVKRQWLGILFDQYRLGGWSTEMWPEWIKPESARLAASRVSIH